MWLLLLLVGIIGSVTMLFINWRKVKRKRKGDAVAFGFFHPYWFVGCRANSNAGGGGERVLWTAVDATLKAYPGCVCVIYTGDDVPDSVILQNVSKRFKFDDLPTDRVRFVHLRTTWLVSDATWPRLTLLMQSLGSVVLVIEAIWRFRPDVYIDTMGYAFTFPFVKVLGIPSAAFVHYPTITADMLGRADIGTAKRFYWLAFAKLYSYAGCCIDVVMANSTWTANHLRAIWLTNRIKTVFPPCNTKDLHCSTIAPRQRVIVCVAQYRKEKNHAMLIEAFRLLTQRQIQCKMLFVGSVRGEEDLHHVAMLRGLANGLDLEMQFDLEWKEVVHLLQSCWIGANAMWNEHFGIGVVEYLAAGLVSVVHDSGGPKLDIVVPYGGQKTGYLAHDALSFADAFEAALALTKDEEVALREHAQQSSERFTEDIFVKHWLDSLQDLVVV